MTAPALTPRRPQGHGRVRSTRAFSAQGSRLAQLGQRNTSPAKYRAFDEGHQSRSLPSLDPRVLKEEAGAGERRATPSRAPQEPLAGPDSALRTDQPRLARPGDRGIRRGMGHAVAACFSPANRSNAVAVHLGDLLAPALSEFGRRSPRSWPSKRCRGGRCHRSAYGDIYVDGCLCPLIVR